MWPINQLNSDVVQGKAGYIAHIHVFETQVGGKVGRSPNVSHEDMLTIRIACRSKEFNKMVSSLSNSKKMAINEIEFGQMLVDNFDVHRSSLKIHGRYLNVHEGDFNRVMGVKVFLLIC